MGKMIAELKLGKTTAEALAVYDGLEPIDLEFMLGNWAGAEIPTGHPLDGLLEASNWHGKRFVDANNVHPLVLKTMGGRKYSTTPMMLMMNLGLNIPLFKQSWMKPVNGLVTRLVSTQKSKARLRMVGYRGKSSATMIYDQLPIHDHFRKIDDEGVMGLMDFKGQADPYFFLLQREA